MKNFFFIFLIILILLLITSPETTISDNVLANTTLLSALMANNNVIRYDKKCLPSFGGGVFIRPSRGIPIPETLWVHFHEGSDLILDWNEDWSEIPEVRLHSSKSGFPSLEHAWCSNPLDFATHLPEPTAVLSEPYDSTTLSLNDDRFLWIKIEIQKDDRSRKRYIVQIDVSDIDRSKILTTGN